MFRSILVPLDGTVLSEAALPIAKRLAQAAASRLSLVHAYQPVAALSGVGPGMLPLMNLDIEMKDQDAGYLMNTAAELVLDGIEAVDYREVDGPAGPAVRDEAVRVGADLVVMVTHGRGSLGRFWHGSVADYLIRNSSIPVLLVRGDGPRSRLGNGPVRGILVALDLSPDSEVILEPVEKLARITGAPVTLVHMILERVPDLRTRPSSPLAGPNSSAPVIPRAEAGQRLEAIAEPLRDRGCRVSTRVVSGFDPAWTLRSLAAEAQYDVLALTSHGAAGIRRLLRGSVADQLVREAFKPVLVLRPHGRKAGLNAE